MDGFIATVPIGRCYQAMQRSVRENAAGASEARFALVAVSMLTLTFALKRDPAVVNQINSSLDGTGWKLVGDL